MSTVWVTQETDHDFRSAEEYGAVHFITADDFTNNRNSLTNKMLMRELTHKIERFNPAIDWLVIAGSPYVSAAIFMLLGKLGHPKVRVLRWDNRDLTYRPIEIELNIQ